MLSAFVLSSIWNSVAFHAEVLHQFTPLSESSFSTDSKEGAETKAGHEWVVGFVYSLLLVLALKRFT